MSKEEIQWRNSYFAEKEKLLMEKLAAFDVKEQQKLEEELPVIDNFNRFTTPIVAPPLPNVAPLPPLPEKPIMSKKIEPILPPIVPGIKTLICRNIPRTGDVKSNVKLYKETFEKYGPIVDIFIPVNADKNSQYYGTFKGFALVKFLTPEAAQKAFVDKYGKLILGENNVQIEFAKADK
jgi:hypothetical protein